jgi:phenylacetate-CoA ligase
MPCGVKLKSKSRQTGGSTGEPLSYKVSNDAFGWWWAAMLRAWQSSGYTFGDRMVTLAGASLSSHASTVVQTAVYDWLRNNTSVQVGSLRSENLDEILRVLETRRPSLVYGYPSILYLVSQRILEKKLQLSHVSRVITTSETLFDGQRSVIERGFRAPVYDNYGCPEAGIVSNECENHGGLHYAMETSFIEVLDSSNRRLSPGQPGRIVATNLLNRAMCFIRYDTGDLGELNMETCSCRRGLQMIGALYGRTRDLITTPNKNIIHGVQINHAIYEYPWVDRYQLIQRSTRDLQLLLAVSQPVINNGLVDLQAEIARLTGMSVSVEVNVPFVKTPGGKTRVIISCEHSEPDQS